MLSVNALHGTCENQLRQRYQKWRKDPDMMSNTMVLGLACRIRTKLLPDDSLFSSLGTAPFYLMRYVSRCAWFSSGAGRPVLEKAANLCLFSRSCDPLAA
jgi:hypothetical protein